jgi:disulfide oxidoreductase YuzD
MIYSKKVMCQDICENTRAHRILDWLISAIQRNFVEYEIV